MLQVKLFKQFFVVFADLAGFFSMRLFLSLIHIFSELRADYYIFDESRYELVGEMSRKVYKLGQPVRVVVAGTDKLLRTVDFVLENQMV